MLHLSQHWPLMSINCRKRMLKELGYSQHWSYRVYKFIPLAIRIDLEQLYKRLTA